MAEEPVPPAPNPAAPRPQPDFSIKENKSPGLDLPSPLTPATAPSATAPSATAPSATTPTEAIQPAPALVPPRPPTSAPEAPARPKAPAHPEYKDGTREIVETIVFVVVLVLLLKTFLAEAFVIPTGSMATTLLGYHKDVICEQCGYRFLVNAHGEAEPDGQQPRLVISATCPNCRFKNDLRTRHGQGGGP